MFSEISHTEKTNTVWSHLYMEPELKIKQNSEIRFLVTRGRGCGEGKVGEGDQNLQTFSYKC